MFRTISVWYQRSTNYRLHELCREMQCDDDWPANGPPIINLTTIQHKPCCWPAAKEVPKYALGELGRWEGMREARLVVRILDTGFRDAIARGCSLSARRVRSFYRLREWIGKTVAGYCWSRTCGDARRGVSLCVVCVCGCPVVGYDGECRKQVGRCGGTALQLLS
jgi:hypothetical protein